MMGNRKERNTFYITHKMELLVWLIVTLIIVSVSTVLYLKKQQNDNDYTIFMNDVDGLIVGSPVRMMGIEVGHITKIKPTNEEVYIKFIITDDSISIPQGTVATVEFSGMAGSKSLELYLPDENTYIDNNVPILTVSPPKRLHDAAGLLNDMFDKINSILYTTSSFGEKIKFMEELPVEEPQNMNKFLKYADDMLNDSTKRANDLNNTLKKYQKTMEK